MGAPLYVTLPDTCPTAGPDLPQPRVATNPINRTRTINDTNVSRKDSSFPRLVERTRRNQDLNAMLVVHRSEMELLAVNGPKNGGGVVAPLKAPRRSELRIR